MGDSPSDGCKYFNPKTGNYCAVGRCLENAEEFQKRFESFTPTSYKFSGNDIDFDSFLKPEYRGHDRKFWGDLQMFHDESTHWTAGGISPRGKSAVEELKIKWVLVLPKE